MSFEIKVSAQPARRSGGVPASIQQQRQGAIAAERKQSSMQDNIKKTSQQTKGLSFSRDEPIHKKGVVPRIGDEKVKQKNDEKMVVNQKALAMSLKSLDSSVKALTEEMKKGGGLGGGGGGKGGLGDMTSGAGQLAAGAGILGVGLGVAAFAASKINQIGNAYIAKAAEQKGSVGVTGFGLRRGQGMYDGAEIGAGMKAYAMSSGRYMKSGDNPNAKAIQVGSIFGQSADEALGQAGKIDRAGGSYTNAVNVAAGSGIQTQIPIFMQAISTNLEEAVRKGVNSSSMSKDIAEDMAALTMSTSKQDVNTAIEIAKVAGNTKSQASKGMVGTPEEAMMWKTAQKELLEKLNSDKKGDVLDTFVKAGILDQKEKDSLMQTQKIGLKDIDKNLGAGGSNSLTREYIGNANDARAAMWVAKGTYENFSPKGTNISDARKRRSVESTAAGMGYSMDSPQLRAALEMEKNLGATDTKVGDREISGRYNKTIGGASGIAVQKDRMLENLLLDHGNKFAGATMTMTKAMVDFADSMGDLTDKLIAGMSKLDGSSPSSPINVVNNNITSLSDKMFNSSEKKKEADRQKKIPTKQNPSPLQNFKDVGKSFGNLFAPSDKK